MRRFVRAVAVALVCVLVSAWTVPRQLCSRRASGFFEGDLEVESALANVVAARVTKGVRPGDLHTGSAHFDGEWALVTNQMAVLGLGQIALAHPETKARWLPAIRSAVVHMLEPDARAFGTKSWGEDGLSKNALAGDDGHIYLGYLNMALSMQRLVDPEMPADHRAMNDALTAAFVRRLDAAPHGLIETFPEVTFPVDVASAVGSIGLHARATRTPMPPVIARWSAHMREKFVDPKSGFLAQTGNPRTGKSGKPRGSGSALAVYFVAFANEPLARELDVALAKNAFRDLAGFGAIAEYPRGTRGHGDIDSGPVLLGVSPAATGFGLAGARLFGDRGRFTSIYRTAYLFGAPRSRGDDWSYLLGEGLGDAILLAMMTASPEAVLP